jgi:hypothetical protein
MAIGSIRTTRMPNAARRTAWPRVVRRCASITAIGMASLASCGPAQRPLKSVEVETTSVNLS